MNDDVKVRVYSNSELKSENPNLKENKNETDNFDDPCTTCMLQLITFILWALIILGILFSKIYVIYIFLAIIYLLYIIFELRSSTYRFLNNIKSSESLYEEVGKLFKTPPVIYMRINCYHYYTSRVRNKNKTVVYSENLDLPYYSCKDVSGLFHLNLENADEKKKKIY